MESSDDLLLPVLSDDPEAMFLSLLVSLGPCHYTRPVFVLRDCVFLP